MRVIFYYVISSYVTCFLKVELIQDFIFILLFLQN